MNESQIYRAAAKTLRKDGWCKFEETNREGKHCLSGALQKVAGDNWRDKTPALYKVIGEMHTFVFNDAADATKRDVIAALNIAADLAS